VWRLERTTAECCFTSGMHATARACVLLCLTLVQALLLPDATCCAVLCCAVLPCRAMLLVRPAPPLWRATQEMFGVY
jgi:hypothetical protein